MSDLFGYEEPERLEPLKVGQRVYAAIDLSEDDWYNTAWDGDDDPYVIPASTKGVVISRSERQSYLYTVEFETGITCAVVYDDGAGMQEVMPAKSTGD